MNQINFRGMKEYTTLATEERERYDKERAKFHRFYLWHKARFQALLNCEAEKGGEEWRFNQLSYLVQLFKKRQEKYYQSIGI